MPISSRLANQSDLAVISSIVFACSTRLKNNGSPDWAHYYTIEKLDEKLKNQTAYIFSLETVPVGVVFLSENDLSYYTDIDLNKFSMPTAPSLYISTLSVSPEFQHQGIASQIVEFCEQTARSKSIKFLRLDCNGDDLPLVNFYKKRGFVFISSMAEESNYFLFEKTII